MINLTTSNETIEIQLKKVYEKYTVIASFSLSDYINSLSNLQNSLLKLHKQEYTTNERIVFTVDQDYYNNNNYGILLKSLQTTINSIDISNFFIIILTTNKNIYSEYTYIFNNFNTDTVSFELYQCNGDYKSNSGSFSELSLYNAIDANIQYSDFTVKLLDNKNFCILPWIALQIDTTGNAYPCCASNRSLPLGKFPISNARDLFNSKRMKQLRLNIINNKQCAECARCYELDNNNKDSYRKDANRIFYKHIDNITQTLDDGTYNNFDLITWNLSINNLCNLSCRICGPKFSSSWKSDAIKLGNTKYIKLQKPKGIVQEHIKHIDVVEQIYFAGGEPLIMNEHYYILEELEKRKRFDVRLIYNTNFTKLHLKNKSVTDYWKKFSNIHIGASLDAMEKRAEYWRHGTIWENIEQNRIHLLKECPHISFSVDATISIVNALHLPDFHKTWVDKGLINASEFSINLLSRPHVFDIINAPPILKTQIREKYNDHLNWLYTIDKLGRATNGYKAVLQMLNKKGIFNYDEFWNEINKVDNIRNERLLDVFPELICLK